MRGGNKMSRIKSTLMLIAFPEIFAFNDDEIMTSRDNNIQDQRKKSYSAKYNKERSSNFNKRLPNNQYPIYRLKPRNMIRK
ncbi:hypothetical protein ES703_25174 [subsurface metagenome]